LRAVALSVTVTGQTRAGFVTAYPDGVSRPTSSNVNFDAGATTSNLVVVPVGPDGYVDLYNGSIATVQIVVNAVGVYLGVFGEPAASCTGFTNSTGMTNSEITIANASDLTGPVPGLYAAAQQATQAYAAYFNSSADICGRSLNVDALDTQTSSAGDQQAAAAACTDAFAMVGSLSLFDNGGAGDVAGCGIPDLRARPSTATRRDVATSFGVSYPDLGSAPAAVADYFTQNQSAATQHAAMLYLNVGSYPTQATSEMAAWQSTAFNFVYSAGIDVSAFNYATYVTAMINKGVKYVQFDGPPQNAIRLAQAMKAQAFSPVFVVDSLTGDDPFAASGGADVDGTFRFTDAVLPFDPPTGELALYEHWLQVVAPGATPSVAGIYAWSAAMLFTRQAMALGGNLNRASLVTSLSHVSGWNSDGLTAPEAVAAKTPAACVRVYHLVSGEWVRGPGSWALCS
jgi:ABC-type branched-subunit amino acid transport system substrate-binding protein